jgi:hypothetical protein
MTSGMGINATSYCHNGARRGCLGNLQLKFLFRTDLNRRNFSLDELLPAIFAPQDSLQTKKHVSFSISLSASWDSAPLSHLPFPYIRKFDCRRLRDPGTTEASFSTSRRLHGTT